MGGRSLTRRAAGAAFVVVAVSFVLAACGSSSTSTKPDVRGVLSFDESTTSDANGALPIANAGLACGSDTQGFGTELLSISNVRLAKVLREWGEIVPGLRANAEGTITGLVFSNADLPFQHPFGDDLTFDIALDRPYSRLAQLHGTVLPAGPLGALHWELEQGLFPHADTTAYLPGFIPQNGDRVVTSGSWIVDCGHTDFHTEIHPGTFVAFGGQHGSATTVHAFVDPYYETQLYTPNPSLAAAFSDPSRFGSGASAPFPAYLAGQIVRLAHVGDPGPLGFLNHLEAHQLEAANHISPPTWYACAPGSKPSGGRLSVSYQFTSRPGVSVRATPDEDTGCVAVMVRFGRAYAPMSVTRKDCPQPWPLINAQAQAALGSSDVNILAAIQRLVPPSIRPLVARTPVVDCYDPLVVPPPGRGGGRTSMVTSGSQPYPFYGAITVSWAKGS